MWTDCTPRVAPQPPGGNKEKNVWSGPFIVQLMRDSSGSEQTGHLVRVRTCVCIGCVRVRASIGAIGVPTD